MFVCQGLRVLDNACETAAEHAAEHVEDILDVWTIVERSGLFTLAHAQLLGIAGDMDLCKRSSLPYLSHVLAEDLSQHKRQLSANHHQSSLSMLINDWHGMPCTHTCCMQRIACSQMRSA